MLIEIRRRLRINYGFYKISNGRIKSRGRRLSAVIAEHEPLEKGDNYHKVYQIS